MRTLTDILILLFLGIAVLLRIPAQEPVKQEPKVNQEVYESCLTTLDMVLPILDKEIKRTKAEIEWRNTIALYSVTQDLVEIDKWMHRDK